MDEDNYGYTTELYHDPFEDAMGYDTDDNYGDDEVDDMLGGLSDADDDFDFAEQRPRRAPRRAPARAPRRPARGRTPPPRRTTPRATPSARPTATPGRTGFATQQQLAQVEERTASGIKALTGRVNDVVAVNAVQSKHIARVENIIKLDGALDFAASVETVSGGAGVVVIPENLLKGLVKFGVIGGKGGPLSNPLWLGLLAFLVSNSQILGNVFQGMRPPPATTPATTPPTTPPTAGQ